MLESINTLVPARLQYQNRNLRQQVHKIDRGDQRNIQKAIEKMKLSLVFFVVVLSAVVVFNEGKFLQYFIYSNSVSLSWLKQ